MTLKSVPIRRDDDAYCDADPLAESHRVAGTPRKFRINLSPTLQRWLSGSTLDVERKEEKMHRKVEQDEREGQLKNLTVTRENAE